MPRSPAASGVPPRPGCVPAGADSAPAAAGRGEAQTTPPCRVPSAGSGREVGHVPCRPELILGAGTLEQRVLYTLI